MIYRDFNGLKLSNLGFGTMRLPLAGEKAEDIDEKRAEEMFDYAMNNGVNYYDTAYPYHSGNAEKVLGRAMAKYDRGSYYLADKFPGYDRKNFGHIREIFPEQLERCKTDYFDFYLFHNVNEMNLKMYLDPQYEIHEYIMARKSEGSVKHVGVSMHGNLETMEAFLKEYGSDMEFCQIQLNWIDWTLQNGREKVEMLNRYNIPIWIMEPLRGGKLAKLEGEALEKFNSICPGMTPVEAAFRFLRSIPGVTVILSGMSDPEQMKANVEMFNTDAVLTKEQFDALAELGKEMANGVPCTGCAYCTSHCPQNISIPKMIELYNQLKFTGKDDFIAIMSLAGYPKSERPDACLGCGACKELCPQQLDIPGIMADFADRLARKKAGTLT